MKRYSPSKPDRFALFACLWLFEMRLHSQSCPRTVSIFRDRGFISFRPLVCSYLRPLIARVRSRVLGLFKSIGRPPSLSLSLSLVSFTEVAIRNKNTRGSFWFFRSGVDSDEGGKKIPREKSVSVCVAYVSRMGEKLKTSAIWTYVTRVSILLTSPPP